MKRGKVYVASNRLAEYLLHIGFTVTDAIYDSIAVFDECQEILVAIYNWQRNVKSSIGGYRYGG